MVFLFSWIRENGRYIQIWKFQTIEFYSEFAFFGTALLCITWKCNDFFCNFRFYRFFKLDFSIFMKCHNTWREVQLYYFREHSENSNSGRKLVQLIDEWSFVRWSDEPITTKEVQCLAEGQQYNTRWEKRLSLKGQWICTFFFKYTSLFSFPIFHHWTTEFCCKRSFFSDHFTWELGKFILVYSQKYPKQFFSPILHHWKSLVTAHFPFSVISIVLCKFSWSFLFLLCNSSCFSLAFLQPYVCFSNPLQYLRSLANERAFARNSPAELKFQESWGCSQKKKEGRDRKSKIQCMRRTCV